MKIIAMPIGHSAVKGTDWMLSPLVQKVEWPEGPDGIFGLKLFSHFYRIGLGERAPGSRSSAENLAGGAYGDF